MAIYNREDSRTALPQLEKRVAELENTSAKIAGSAREFTLYSAYNSGGIQLQFKRTKESSLMLEINDNGVMTLRSVPNVNGKDDWSHATTIWSVDMTTL